jgi:hypothetical protein
VCVDPACRDNESMAASMSPLLAKLTGRTRTVAPPIAVRPDHYRHLYRANVTYDERWAKHLVPTAKGHAR